MTYKHYALINVHAPTNVEKNNNQQKTESWENLENTLAKNKTLCYSLAQTLKCTVWGKR